MKNKKLIKYFKLLIPPIILAVAIRIFLFEIFQIPSDSMCTTLLNGDILLVNKLKYGARLGFSKKQNAEIRMFSFGGISHNDVVVFNSPGNDTIYSDRPDIDFHTCVGKKTREKALADTIKFGRLIYIPAQDRVPYIKRCIALPGDTFEMHDGKPYVNSKIMVSPQTILPRKNIYISDAEINERRFPAQKQNNPKYWQEVNDYRSKFPNNALFKWNHEIFGPVVIPKKGVTVLLNYTNIWLYKRIIDVYEHNTLVICDSGIFINNKRANTYTFKMNYYFMLGDNRQNSIDSMWWGFVPEDHIIGKAVRILFSYGEKENKLNGIRWERILKTII